MTDPSGHSAPIHDAPPTAVPSSEQGNAKSKQRGAEKTPHPPVTSKGNTRHSTVHPVPRRAPRDPKTFIEDFTNHPVVDEVMRRLSR